jgi:hypothetical protein
VPYVLPAFSDLLAEPVRVHDYGLFLGHAAERALVEQRADHGFARALYDLGVDRLTSGFRAYWQPGYCDFCEATAEGDHPLEEALDFIGARRADGPRIADTGLDLETQRILAELVLDLDEARRWAALGFRNVDPAVLAAVASVRDLEETQADAKVYHPAFDDLARTWDLPSLLTGAQIAVNAVDRAGLRLLAVGSPTGRTGEDLRWKSTSGAIEIRRRCDGRPHGEDGALLVLDLAGCDDVWTAGGASSPSQPVSVLLDLGGVDRYGPEEPPHGDTAAEEGPPAPAFGAGLAGIGVLWDGAGDDRYAIDEQGQGYAQGGAGILLDHAGNDTYIAHHSAQGAAWFGLGLLVDEAGNDTYRSITTSQGAAGALAAASLVDLSGDDTYYVEPSAEVAGLAGDYHSGEHILGNASQGTAMGRRGDLTDGHSWAGGLATLIDLAGNDRYTGGNWVQGVGYWYGMGLLYDRAGDDTYRSVYFSTASGAHYAIGALMDLAGDDRYTMKGDPALEGVVGGAGLAFGWDYVVALLVDTGGNDAYAAELLAMGCANIRSVAIFADIGGDDRYTFPEAGDCGLGAADRRENYTDPLHSNSRNANDAFFVDLGGQDTYLDLLDRATGETRPATRWADGTHWTWPLDGENERQRSFAVGLDAAEGSFWGHRPVEASLEAPAEP